LIDQKVLVLLPCLNESSALGRTIENIRVQIPHAIIVVIDNGSTDDSIQVARSLGVVLIHEPQKGKGNAFRRGLNFITPEISAVLLVDSDDTYGLENLGNALTAVIHQGYDMVVGNRTIQKNERNNLSDPFRVGHVLGNRALSAIGRTMHPAGVLDTLSGWRVFSPRFLHSFPGGSTGFEIEAELNAHAYLINSAVLNVNVSYRGRAEGSTSKLNTYQDGFRILRTSLRFFRNDRPQLAFSLFATPWFIGSFYFTYRAVAGYVKSGLVSQFPSLIAGVGAFVITSLLLVTGMILERIKQVRVINAKYIYRNLGNR
jgi:glycosyltransferase involved in cell wall biosynthesis